MIGILGAGSWATAIVKILSNNETHLNWWVRKPQTIAHIKKYRHNPNYLSDIELPVENITFYADLKQAIAHSDTLLLAVPSAFISDTFKNIAKTDFEEQLADSKVKRIFSLIKGTMPPFSQPHHSNKTKELGEKGMMVSSYFHHHFDIPLNSFGIIGGPCHAEEVALEKLSYLTIGCSVLEEAENMAELLSCRYIKTCTSTDMQGIEFTAALKNIYAIASGICHGLGGYGDNFQSVLVANAIQEIKRFIDVAARQRAESHNNGRDINLSAYLGDLLVTAYSPFSRNRMLGSLIGKGYSVKYAQGEMNMVAEGYYAVRTIFNLNSDFKVEMPICDAVYRILYEKISPSVEMRLLAEKMA